MLWLKGKRPAEPADWKNRIRDAEAMLRREFESASPGQSNDLATVKFPDHWKYAKHAFRKAQNGKCGYCEQCLDSALDGGNIDHFRPKAEVEDLSEQGKEMPDDVCIAPGSRKVSKRWPRGYWWLAYDWNNFLLACGDCNCRWKIGVFPIVGGRKGPPTPEEWEKENPLLLNPFGNEDPAEHLEFSEFGGIVPLDGSPLGRETIKTCNLDRGSLRGRRHSVALQTGYWVSQVIIACTPRRGGVTETDRILAREAIRNLRHSGEETMEFCGMVRNMVCQSLGLSAWSELSEAILPDK